MSKFTVYANEIDKKAAHWLGCLPMRFDSIDTRSIKDVKGDDIKGFDQCHFFAGIGGWPLALEMAGWSKDIPVWTGSCPCQPFSSAGKRKGVKDERHLWPEFLRLIDECRPPAIFGEQVASAEGRKWLTGDAQVQRMRDRQTIERILQGQVISPGLQGKMQALLSIGREEAEGCCPCCGKVGEVQELPQNRAGESLAERGEVQSEEERFIIEHLRGRSSVNALPWALRTNGYPFQSGWWQDLGQSFVGQGRQQQRLRFWKCQSDPVLRKRDGERLGAVKDIGDCRCDSCGEKFAVGISASGFGGQIERAFDLRTSFTAVRADLEALGYAVGAADLCAAGVGSPHIRQRLFWVAYSDGGGCERRLQRNSKSVQSREQAPCRNDVGGCCKDSRLADSEITTARSEHDLPGWQPDTGEGSGDGYWNDVEYLYCRDEKCRPTKPGLHPLAHGIPGRVAQLRGLGNAIVPQVAATFIEAFMESVGLR